jgi:hypothetical protein
MDLSENQNYITYRRTLLMKEISPTTAMFVNPRDSQIFSLKLRWLTSRDKVEIAIMEDMLKKFELDRKFYLDYYEVGKAPFAF